MALEEANFKQNIEPYIALHYKRPGWQTVIHHYQFFCAVLSVLKTGMIWRVICCLVIDIVYQLQRKKRE